MSIQGGDVNQTAPASELPVHVPTAHLEAANGKHWQLPAPPYQARKLSNPLHVALLVKAQDYHCCLLAGLGFNYACISEHTGLSIGQVGYRLKKAGISVKMYRMGKTVLSNLVIGSTGRKAALALNRALVEFAPGK